MRLMLALLLMLTAGCGMLPPVAKSGPADASAVLEILKAKGLPIGETLVITAESDPNHLLGRPGGYTSKVAWRDTRVREGDNLGGVRAGGSIEMYPDAAVARQRGEYISAIVAKAPIFGEYTYVQGRIVLRVSKILTPDQAEQYRAVLAELPG